MQGLLGGGKGSESGGLQAALCRKKGRRRWLQWLRFTGYSKRNLNGKKLYGFKS